MFKSLSIVSLAFVFLFYAFCSCKEEADQTGCMDIVESNCTSCVSGYEKKGDRCKPICVQGCVFGECIAPNLCRCHFSYTGLNCSMKCLCNGHSDCIGIDQLDKCIECRNNTQGKTCDKCKPFFVATGGKCLPCKAFCHGHSDICVAPEVLNDTSKMVVFEQVTTIKELGSLVQEGSHGDAVCLNCLHNTEGERCDRCVPGYFKRSESIDDGCRPCYCHGHGDMCDPVSGESCDCRNNTETDRQCTGKPHKTMLTPCYQIQCAKCREYFLGVPTYGHACYRHMFLDRDYCFDPDTQEECNRNPAPLPPGRTVFFAVQPRYMNVDIRVVVDVAMGAVDLYLTAKDDAFVVDYNKSSGEHLIWLDNRYNADYQEINFEDVILYKKNYLFNDSTIGVISTFDLGPPLRIRHHFARGLTEYLTMTNPHEILVVRNLRNRLVITLPQDRDFDLRNTRFYMILRTSAIENGTEGAFGNLFFRQDQSRIDLFVFFSVFFSCFFLFLASCVVAWKVKQAFDMRRARRLHAAEMKHMASRPFSFVMLLLEPYSALFDDFEFALSSPAHHVQGKKSKAFKLRGSHSSLKDSPKHPNFSANADRYLIRPIAVEPTSDGSSAIVSTVILLPGGSSAPIRMTLASSLVSLKGSHQGLTNVTCSNSSNVAVVSGAFRAAYRRRPRF